MNGFNFSLLYTRSYRWAHCIAVSLFFVLFMMSFLPFGVSNYNPNHKYTLRFFTEISAFGVLTFLLTILNEFGIKRIFPSQDNWTKLILWILWSYLVYGSINFLYYNWVGNWHDLHFSSGIKFILQYSSVLIIPTIGVLFYFHYSRLKERHLTLLNDQEKKVDPTLLIPFEGQGQTEKLMVTNSSFLYAKSQDNYVEIYYLQNGEISKYLIRTTLSKLVETIEVHNIQRCHRSYMVNLFKVESLIRKSNRLKLILKDVATPIPVSKTYTQNTLSILEEIKHFT